MPTLADHALAIDVGTQSVRAIRFDPAGELVAMGPFMPGLLPGVGFPLQGQVRDARTYLPVGGATVSSGPDRAVHLAAARLGGAGP